MFPQKPSPALSTKRLLSRFFSDFKPWPYKPGDKHDRGRQIMKDMHLGNSLTVSGGYGREDIERQTLLVEPTAETQRLVEGSILHIENDTLHYELIVFKSYAVLHVKYSKIIGGRKLSQCISTASIPALLIERKE